ncbi:MAG: tRNA dihydrouridine synthase DusB [Myxococcota bacterium]
MTKNEDLGGRLASLAPLRIGKETFAPIALAPMAGVSEMPYRIIAAEMGAGWTPTELVSARGLEFGNQRTETYLRHDPDREPALTVQLYGADPESMARAAELSVQRGARIVDVNMGCPVKKITKNQAGSALLLQPERAETIVSAMVERLGDRASVTVKLRSGWDAQHINAPELGRRLEAAGAAAITLHARTRAQAYEGRADWDLIRQLVDSVHAIPIIANGDIDGVSSAAAAIAQTGCAAVMVGRAALGNPWVFRELNRAWRGLSPAIPPGPRERVATILEHLDASVRHTGSEIRALHKFRQHLAWYSRGFRGGARFRDEVMTMSDRGSVEAAISRFFGTSSVLDPSEGVRYSAAYG